MCSVCGNNVCEPFESCAICPGDCGTCETIGCIEIVTCALNCIDLNMNPPGISLSCAANCVALGCSNVQFFVDQVLNCAVANLGTCGGDFGCIQTQCDAEFAACIGATCPDD